MKTLRSLKSKVSKYIRDFRGIGYGGIILFDPPRRERNLTPFQELFCEWNSERLNISIGESRERYLHSMNMFVQGHGADAYRSFCDLSYQVYKPFFSDGPREAIAAYHFFGLMHFLRMLSYQEMAWPSDHPILQNWKTDRKLTILDFGCGLAQSSRGLVDAFKSRGQPAHLVLCDIPTLRKDFLSWWSKKSGQEIEFLDSKSATDFPQLPQSDICIATEVFEHVHNTIGLLRSLDQSIRQGGYLYASIGDHQAEFMHVSPDLADVRRELMLMGYSEIIPALLYKKAGELPADP